jgi:hypothetical protein
VGLIQVSAFFLSRCHLLEQPGIVEVPELLGYSILVLLSLCSPRTYRNVIVGLPAPGRVGYEARRWLR